MISVQALLNQLDPVHPEQGPDEVCLGIFAGLDISEICWDTARMGKQPHDADGRQASRELGEYFAVFIKRAELLDPWTSNSSRACSSTATN